MNYSGYHISEFYAIVYLDSSDYKLRTTRIWLTRGHVTVHVDLKRDSIALEGVEKFQVQLSPESAAELRPNEFLRDTVNVEITDDTSEQNSCITTS